MVVQPKWPAPIERAALWVVGRMRGDADGIRWRSRQDWMNLGLQRRALPFVPAQPSGLHCDELPSLAQRLGAFELPHG